MNARVDLHRETVSRERAAHANAQTANLERAMRCIKQLDRMGLLVLHVRMTGSCPPRIRIQNSPLAAQLNGAPYIHRCVGGTPEDTMVCVMDGCQVEWIQRGH